jgi:hypothetical protein
MLEEDLEALRASVRKKHSPALAAGTMKKPRLGTNDWGTDDRGDEQGFFDSWVTCDERNAHHGGGLSLSDCHQIEHFVSPFRPSLDPSTGPLDRSRAFI